MGILKYFISIFLFLAILSLNAQEKLERQIFVRAGIDASRFALPFVHEFGLSGAEFTIDGEIHYDFFPTFETGFNKIKDINELHSYQLSGNYYKIGLNYNLLKYKHRLDHNLLFIGFRYAFNNYSHQTDEINIENLWGSYSTSFPKIDLNNTWFESVIGLKAEIAKNFYMGYTLRVKTMLSKPEYANFIPFWIPGFGAGTKVWSIGMSYSLSYAIPIKNPTLDFEK